MSVSPARRVARASAPVLGAALSIGAYIAASPFRRQFRADPPEVWAGTAVAAAVGVSSTIRSRGVDRVVAGVATVAGPALAWWYLHRYSDFGRGEDRLEVGAPFPGFSLPTSDGGTRTLDDYRGRRLMVMTYRGGWCPFCVTELLELRDNYAAILDRGVEVVAVSVDDAAQSEAMRRRVGLDITFLSDHGGALLDALGVADDAGLVPGLGVAGFGGDESVGSAIYLPTTALLDEDGIVRWVHRADNYRVRATAATVLDAIDTVFP